MRELEIVRRLAPPVEPPAPEAVARMRARAFGRRRPQRRAGWLLAPAAVAATLALAVVLLQAGGSREPAFAAEVVRAAESAPRLLLDDWTVARVDEWNAGSGEMTFSQGDRRLDLSWFPTRVSGPKVGAAKDPDPGVELEVGVAGARATVRRYAGTDEYTAVWRSGDVTVQARGSALSPDDFVSVVRGFERVGANQWLRALPADAVTPSEQRDAVKAMLQGLPLPPGLDVRGLGEGTETRDRYQLGALVAGTVACGWIAAWVEAERAGDRPASERAAAALATAHEWPILHEMTASGDYPEVLWGYADAVAGDGAIAAGKLGVTVAESYEDALCT